MYDVADRVAEQLAERVAAAERPVPRLDRPRDDLPVAREDAPAVDPLLLEQRAAVERVVAQRLGLEDRPPRRLRDEQREEDRDEGVEAEGGRVHRGALARFETVSSSASRMKFATIDEPP